MVSSMAPPSRMERWEMAPLNRRTFVTLSAAAVAGAVVGPDISMATGTAAVVTPTRTIADVKHVVILMQENRGFDHYFGMLKGVQGFSDQSAIQIANGTGTTSVFNQPNDTKRQYPWALSSKDTSSSKLNAQCNDELDHGWRSQHDAWNKGRMDSWVAAKKSVRTLGYLQRSDIPFHYQLADHYTICDAYFSSALSATGPNRTYHWSGTIGPDGKLGGPAYNGGDEEGLKWKTYAEALEAAKVSWKVYQVADDNFGDNALAYFTQFTDAAAGSALKVKGMGSVPVSGKSRNTPVDIAAAIKADVVAGRLPQVSWVVADEVSSEHPARTPNDGARLVHMVIDALNADTSVYNSSILFLNYDENDGFFDHVPPPAAPEGTPGEFLKVDGKPTTNIGLGFRVPLIAVSPWSRGGWVSSEVFDHTSVLRFLETWTATLPSPAKQATCAGISAWRRKVCGDLTSAFDFTTHTADLPTDLLDTSATNGASCGSADAPEPTTNELPRQETGTRPARPLPYQPNANLDSLDHDKQLVWLKMWNSGTPATRPAHYAVYANAHRTGGPWPYTIGPTSGGAGGTDTSVLDDFRCGPGYGGGKYDLSITGPNRFLRRFRGDIAKPGKDLGVTATYTNDSSSTPQLGISFALTNNGTEAVTFTITANQYADYGTAGLWTVKVAAAGSGSQFFDAVAKSHGWYDFTVTASSDTSWSQRFSGHLETGSPSVSG